jgi:uncharacterized membrane protein
VWFTVALAVVATASGVMASIFAACRMPAIIVVTAMVLDLIVLGAFVWVRASTDALGLWVAAAGIVLIVAGERLFMRSHVRSDGTMDM